MKPNSPQERAAIAKGFDWHGLFQSIKWNGYPDRNRSVFSACGRLQIKLEMLPRRMGGTLHYVVRVHDKNAEYTTPAVAAQSWTEAILLNTRGKPSVFQIIPKAPKIHFDFPETIEIEDVTNGS